MEPGYLCLRIFAIPELADQICALLARPDNARLLRTCHSLFRDLRGYVWESTDAIVIMVSMIPGCGIIEHGDDILSLYQWTMIFPPALNLSRLGLYAPYVKTLDIPLELPSVDQYEGWDEFLACTKSTPLLPNLEHIRVSPHPAVDGRNITLDSVNWITAFWSPSLRRFEVLKCQPWGSSFDDPGYIWTELQYAHRLLHNMSERSPRLESLHIFPADLKSRIGRGIGGLESRELKSINYSSPSLTTPIAVSGLRALRTLSATPFFLDNEVFSALARLPLLESISIDDPYTQARVHCDNLHLSEQSFPSLKHLDLKRLTWGTIRNLAGQRSFWRGLRTVRIHGFEPSRWPLPEDDPHMWSTFISSFARHDSPINSLSLIGDSTQAVTPQMVDSLKKLPLITLSLCPVDTRRTDWVTIARGLPTVEDLTLGVGNGVFPGDLHVIIAALPRLRRLSLPTSTEFRDRLSTEAFPLEPYSLASFLLETNFHFDNDPREDAEKVAKFLYALRPNTTYSPGRYDPAFIEGEYWENPLNTEIINATLSKLRAG